MAERTSRQRLDRAKFTLIENETGRSSLRNSGPLLLQTAWRLRATGEGEVWSDRHAGEGARARQRQGRIGVEVQGAACAGGHAIDGVACERCTLREGDAACRPRTCVGTTG